MTDTQRVASLFKTSSGRLVNLLEIIQGMGIVEYSGRISDCRKEWGCTCGKDPSGCAAAEHIINVKKGWYKYVSKNKEVPVVSVSQQEINTKKIILEKELQRLRDEWRIHKGTKRALEIESEAVLVKQRLKLVLGCFTKPQVVKTSEVDQSEFAKSVYEAVL